MKTNTAIIALMFGVATATTASAQSMNTDIVSLSEFRYDDVYATSVSAEELMDNFEVHDVNGEEIGDVEDIIVGADGKLLALVAEVGGFWDIGDTHVSVPWDQVSMAGGALVIPVTEATVDEYGLFDREYFTAADARSGIVSDVDDAAVGPNAFRLQELIGDYARLRGTDDALVNYGYVRDVMLRDGEIAAVVVNPDTGYGTAGYAAYPYYRGGYAPGSPYYDMPYTQTDIEGQEEFDYDRIELM